MEKYAVLSATCRGSFWERLCHLYMKTGDYVDMENLENRHLVYVKVFLSDICNQYSALLESQLWQDYLSQVPCSVIGQPPLDGSKVSLLVCTSDAADTAPICSVRLNKNEADGTDVYRQTVVLFNKFVDNLLDKGQLRRFAALRVWLYVANPADSKDAVDKAIDDVFKKYGLNQDNLRITVTCVEGLSQVEGAVVALDYIIYDESFEPVVALNTEDCAGNKDASCNFCNSIMAIKSNDSVLVDLPAFVLPSAEDADPSQLDMSQYAGMILGNIGVRLKNYGVAMNDVRCFIVYVRDFSDYDEIDRLLSAAFPRVPHAIVKACGTDISQPVMIGCVAFKKVDA